MSGGLYEWSNAILAQMTKHKISMCKQFWVTARDVIERVGNPGSLTWWVCRPGWVCTLDVPGITYVVGLSAWVGLHTGPAQPRIRQPTTETPLTRFGGWAKLVLRANTLRRMLDALTRLGGLSKVDTVPKWQTRGWNVSVLAGGPYCQRTDTGESVEEELTVLNRGKLRGLPWVKLGSS